MVFYCEYGELFGYCGYVDFFDLVFVDCFGIVESSVKQVVGYLVYCCLDEFFVCFEMLVGGVVVYFGVLCYG